MTATTRETGARPGHIDAEPDGHGVAATAERLMAEFGGRVDLPTITTVVLRCRRDLSGTPAPAMPELLERYARQRLMQVPALR